MLAKVLHGTCLLLLHQRGIMTTCKGSLLVLTKQLLLALILQGFYDNPFFLDEFFAIGASIFIELLFYEVL